MNYLQKFLYRSGLDILFSNNHKDLIMQMKEVRQTPAVQICQMVEGLSSKMFIQLSPTYVLYDSL